MKGKPSEMTYASDLKELINGFSKTHTFIKRAKVEEIVGGSGKRLDIIIYDEQDSPNLVIEVKRPEKNPLDPDVIVQARDYAERLEINYFVTHNVNHIALWEIDNILPIWQANVTTINELSEYEGFMDLIEAKWKDFFDVFSELLIQGEIPVPFGKEAVDMIVKHVAAIGKSPLLIGGLRRKLISDRSCRKSFDKWCEMEGRSPPEDEMELVQSARVFSSQYVNVLCNRVLFYNALRKYHSIPVLIIPESGSSEFFSQLFSMYWNEAKRCTGDFETIFDVGTIDDVPLPEECFGQLSFIVSLLSSYDYSKISLDVIGDIFEALIPFERRHLLGQFFTPPEVCDLILSLSHILSNEGKLVLDPAAGSGGFLSRAYDWLHVKYPSLSHGELVNNIWGIDIATFPSHLSTVNIALKSPDQTKIYPNIIRDDFFNIDSSSSRAILGVQSQTRLDLGFDKKSPEATIQKPSGEDFSREIPEFDMIVGNPPYTRFQELSNALFGADYHSKLESLLQEAYPNFSFGDTSPIYTYFVSHSLNFLRSKGALTMILLSQRLNTNYGENFKDFLLENVNLKLILASPHERWFPDGQLIPIVISIVNSPPKSSSTIRFVSLNFKLVEELNPPDLSIDDFKHARYFDKVEELANKILHEDTSDASILEVFQNKIKFLNMDEYSIVDISQSDIDPETNWDIYLRFPSEHAKLFTEKKEMFCNLSELGYIDYGIVANPIYYFDIDHKQNPFEIRSINSDAGLFLDGKEIARIDLKYLYPFISKTPDTYLQDDVHRLFSTKLDSLRAQSAGFACASYLKWGEKPTHKIRGRTDLVRLDKYRMGKAGSGWADLDIPKQNKCKIFLPSIFFEIPRFFATTKACYHGHNIFGFIPRGEVKDVNTDIFIAILNSLPSLTSSEFIGRQHLNRDGSRSLKVERRNYLKFRIPDIRKFSDKQLIQLRKIGGKIKRMKKPSKFAADFLQSRAIKELNEIVCKEYLKISENDIKLLENEYINLVQMRTKPPSSE